MRLLCLDKAHSFRGIDRRYGGVIFLRFYLFIWKRERDRA